VPGFIEITPLSTEIHSFAQNRC